MNKIIDGEFRRIGKKRRPAPKAMGSAGTSIWEWLHPGEIQTENVILTGTNLPDQSLFDQVKQKFNDAVAQLDDASIQLDNAEANLASIQDDLFTNGNLNDHIYWTKINNQIIAAQATRNAARDTVNQVASWIQNIKTSLGLSNLGILPAIPWALIAGIVAAAAALYAIANLANTLFNDWQIAQWNAANIAAQQAGEPALIGSPQLARTDMGITTGVSNIFSNAGDLVKWIAIALAIWLVVPMLGKKHG